MEVFGGASVLIELPLKKPSSGGFWWCLRKRLRNSGSERMPSQRWQTREARGSEDGSRGRRRRISGRRFSSSTGDAVAGEERQRRLIILQSIAKTARELSIKNPKTKSKLEQQELR